MSEREAKNFLTNNELISCLWNKNSFEKCRLGLSDVLIFENGIPVRWYVTGKGGEVVKKRGGDLLSVSQRWSKISILNESSIMAIVRQEGGIMKFLSFDAWQSFVNELSHESSIKSVHCFVSGASNCIYRNTYTVKNRLSAISRTYTYGLNLSNNQQPVSTLLDSELILKESKANQIKNILDLATNTVVRYLEFTLSVKVTHLSLDYVIDKKSQVWMLWSNEAQIAKIPNKMIAHDLNGDLIDNSTDEIVSSCDISKPRVLAERLLGKELVANQVSLVAATSKDGFGKMKNKTISDETPYTLQWTENKINEQNNFPNPFGCKGDYCDFMVQLNSDVSRPFTQSAASKRLFSRNELSMLQAHPQSSEMLQVNLTTESQAQSMIAMKSIILARQEQRGLVVSNASQLSYSSYPVSPRTKLGTRKSLEDSHLPTGLDAKLSQQIEVELRQDREQREVFNKTMTSYYEQVRVCPACASVYGCLDWARNLLGQANDLSSLSVDKSISEGQTKNKLNNLTIVETAPRLQNSSSQPSYQLSTAASLNAKAVSKGRKSVAGDLSVSKKTTGAKWKDHIESNESSNNFTSGSKFVGLDDYLRGNSLAIKNRNQERGTNIDTSMIRNISPKDDRLNLYYGKVLLACNDVFVSDEVRLILEEALFQVHLVPDGRQAINDFILKEGGFDCVVVQSDLPLNNANKVTEGIREYEKLLRKKAAAFASLSGQGVQPPTRRHPVICMSYATSPVDIKSYMQSDMDGCVSLPLVKTSLISTIRASIPHHLTEILNTASVVEQLASKSESKVYHLGSLGELKDSVDSSTMAAKTLSIANSSEEDIAFNGIVQIDADTRVPFTVLDASKSSKSVINPIQTYFSLIICHDIFDTIERLKIFFRPMVQRYIGMQVLLWNYPGQAFTEWREEQLLNNEYLATCLNEVLGQVGEKGTRDFNTARPFYVMGYGYGVSVASFYASHYRIPNLRGLLNVNGWSFLDSYLAGIMHDCINVFQCSPPSRPDLPVYFFSRFIFSKEYLTKVSVPLALNIYTAVHNSISVKGRLSLCKGVLQLVDVRPLLKEIDCPIICMHSTEDAFVRPLHTEPFVNYRAGEVHSIHKVLRNPRKTCVIWMSGGHEVFQENKKQSQLIIEQILTGFHESHDVSFSTTTTTNKPSGSQTALVSSLPWETGSKEKTVEDKFIDNVIGSINKINHVSSVSTSNTDQTNITKLPNIHNKMVNTKASEIFPHHDSIESTATANLESWNVYSHSVIENQLSRSVDFGKSKKRVPLADTTDCRVIDPTSVNFDRRDRSGVANKSTAAQDYPEVKEFMSWRLKRNKKRLQRLQGAARIIQGAFRAYIARKFVHGIRRLKAALFIQRVFRGWRGRFAFQNRARRIWAAQVIQRSWRGYLGRKWYFITRLRIVAAANIQRTFRGFRARIFVKKLKRKRFLAASLIQAMGRRYIARKDAWRRRQYRNSSKSIQRIFRGYLGHKRAIAERNKYIFSRSQSQGIEFGRQMLLEHKLHATRLQSDVTLLTQEKVGAEEQIEALLEEISSFEEGVRTLEKEMHQLSKVESEAAAFMDEDSKFELREQKIRLDREFGEMLSKIGTRKDMLNGLEKKLSTVDKSRQSKEEELRTLERKLVVLLEEQQNELNSIKRKQDVRGAMLAASHEELTKVTGGDGTQTTDRHVTTRGGVVSSGGSIGSGPSLQEKKQAAQLMQSTETLMKFGFMSMSMTYFSSLNMIKALRTVSAQDTVMAALSDIHSQRAVGQTLNTSSTGGGTAVGHANFLPDLHPGQLSGQQVLKVSAWSVDDVAKWLQTLFLGQYSEAFIDSAVDGEFLFDLNDDDLKNTLGIEHRLHRKKILNCVHRLKLAEAQRDNRLNDLLRETGSLEAPVLTPDTDPQNAFGNPFSNGEGGGDMDDDRAHIDGPRISLTELFSLVRHSKFSLLKEAIDYMPNKSFDKTLVQVGYVPDHGTAYLNGYDRLPFHTNKADEFGNTMLSLACQNGNMKICKYLMQKGANPNHQNKSGQTPAHFAIAYKFFDLSNWLFENGASDLIENKFGLSPYDGLSSDGADEVLALEN